MHRRRELEDLGGDLQQLAVLLVSSWTVFHCWSAMTCLFASAQFWLIITNVERKIASSETIIVSNPNGDVSTPEPIQLANQMTWRYTNAIEPAKRVIA